MESRIISDDNQEGCIIFLSIEENTTNKENKTVKKISDYGCENINIFDLNEKRE